MVSKLKRLGLTLYEQDKISKILMSKHYLTCRAIENTVLPHHMMVEVAFSPLNSQLHEAESIFLDEEDRKSIGDIFYSSGLALVEGEWNGCTHYYLSPVKQITDLFNQAYDLKKRLLATDLETPVTQEEIDAFLVYFDKLTYVVRTIDINHYIIQTDLEELSLMADEQYAFAKRLGYSFP